MLVNSESVSKEIDESEFQREKHREQALAVGDILSKRYE
jgi:hypothetical protein